MSNALIGFLRGIGTVVVFAVISYLANASNLTGILNPTIAALVAALALAGEHALSPSGTALMGAVNVK